MVRVSESAFRGLKVKDVGASRVWVKGGACCGVKNLWIKPSGFGLAGPQGYSVGAPQNLHGFVGR